LLLWLGPPGSDTAAHVYQAWLFRHHGFVLWDNYWYSGRYTFATYSWLYYPFAVVVGIKVLAALSAGVAAAAFARVVAYPPLVLVFRNPGRFPFSWQEATAAALFCVGAIVLAPGRPIRGVFVAWLALVALSFVFPSTLGENAARLRFIALPLALLVLRGRPLALAAPLALVAAAYNISPLVWSFVKGHDERAQHASYWAPAIAFLRAHNTPDFRVNALD